MEFTREDIFTKIELYELDQRGKSFAFLEKILLQIVLSIINCMFDDPPVKCSTDKVW